VAAAPRGAAADVTAPNVSRGQQGREAVLT
jgi:hypothetical protein